MINDVEIKPCPFCGEKKSFDFQFDIEDCDGVPTRLVCENCGAAGPWIYCVREESGLAIDDDSLNDVIYEWNLSHWSSIKELPTWDSIVDKVSETGLESLNDLEIFIYDQEPSGPDEEIFRDGLLRLVNFVRNGL